MLCYVMWNLFTVGTLQFCSGSTIASLEANQNRPKIQYYGNEQYNFLYFMYIKTIILICIHTKTSKFHKPSLGQDLKNFILV